MLIASKKWWWPLIAFLPDMAAQSAWLLYRMYPANALMPLDLLGFKRHVVDVYIRLFSNERQIGRPMARVVLRRVHQRVPKAIRKDWTNHYLKAGRTQRRCAHCGTKTKMLCAKCSIPCHVYCSTAFHA